MTLTIESLLSFVRWRPLRDFPYPTDIIGEGLVRICPCLYFKVVPYNRQLLRTDAGQHISLLAWAESDGAALQAFNFLIEEDKVRQAVSPPAEFLITLEATTYASIMKAAKERGLIAVMEHASYRIASDGRFVHKVIQGGGYHFYFRSRRHSNGERPYCIALNERALKGTEP